MPEVPVTNEHGEIVSDAVLQLLGVMLYPNDAGNRSAVLAAQRANAEYMAHTGDETGSDVAWKLLNNATKNATQGSYAGLIFMDRLALAMYAPEHCSINKAVWLVYNEMAQAKSKLYSGKATPSAYKSTIYPSWSGYRRAASLWAAWNILYKDNHDRLYGDAEAGRYVTTLLAVSEAMVDLAARHGVEPDPDPWRAPASLSVPPAQITVPELTDWQRQILREYKAPTSPP